MGWNANVAPGTTLQAFGYCANTTGSSSAPAIISPLGNGGGTGGRGWRVEALELVAGGGRGRRSQVAAVAAHSQVAAVAAHSQVAAVAAHSRVAAVAAHSRVAAVAAQLAGGGSGGALAGGGSGGALAGGGSGGALAGGGSGGRWRGAGRGSGGSVGYVPTSEYLLFPDRAVATLKSLADFRAKSRDDKNGGFFTLRQDGRNRRL